MVTGPSFPFPWPRQVVSIRQLRSAVVQSPHAKLTLPGCAGPLRQWSTLPAIRDGVVSLRVLVKIHISAPPLHAHKFSAFRELTTAVLTRSLPVPNTG